MAAITVASNEPSSTVNDTIEAKQIVLNYKLFTEMVKREKELDERKDQKPNETQSKDQSEKPGNPKGRRNSKKVKEHKKIDKIPVSKKTRKRRGRHKDLTVSR